MEDAGPAEAASDDPAPEGTAPPDVVRTADRTEWVVNWSGVLPVVLVLLIGFVLWRWLDGVGGSDDADRATATSPSTEITAAPSTTSAATTTTGPTGTTAPSTTTTSVVGEPQVRIRGRMGPCSFGENCLIAGFSIEGFDEHPGRFLCIYPNSERERTFSDDDVDVACVTADEGDTITIEVAGVRSATISEEQLDGGP